MEIMTRFSPLVRKGLRFRRRFEAAKQAVGPREFEWYPYDCFTNLFPLQHLMRQSGHSVETMAAGKPILDIGAADGALSFYFESLGLPVHAIDFSGTNMNRMEGIRALATQLGSAVKIVDADLDGVFHIEEQYGLALLLGTLYHLKNPFHVLEELAHRARFCFVSTRVARLSPDRTVRFGELPLAYLLSPAECNADTTNYWIFSPKGLEVLLERTGWRIESAVNSGDLESDPVSCAHDERMFVLAASLRA